MPIIIDKKIDNNAKFKKYTKLDFMIIKVALQTMTRYTILIDN